MPPLKSISVTPIRRGGNRKAPSPAIDDVREDRFALQAALARYHSLSLVTRNTRDFPPDRYGFVVIPYVLRA